MKKRSAILLISAMLVALTAGCSQGNNSNNEESPSATNGGTAKVENLNETGFPVVNEPITLELMGKRGANHGDWANLTYFKELQKLTNIQLTFNTPPQESYEEKKNLAFASEELPDFFFHGELSSRDEAVYGTQGLIIPLEGLIDQYAPNLKKIFEDRPEVKATITAPDGHIYRLPVLSEDFNNYTPHLWTTKDMMAKAGAQSLPTSTNELYQVLTGMKTAGLVPLSAENMDAIRTKLIAPFGKLMSSPKEGFMGETDGKVEFVPATDAYKEYLTFANKLFTDKLLDPEIFSHTSQEFNAKVKAGKVGMVAHIQPNGLYGYNGEAVAKNMEMIPPMTSPINDNAIYQKKSGITQGTFAITKNNEHPEATIRMIDFLYSLRGSILVNTGILLSEEVMNDTSKVVDIKTEYTNALRESIAKKYDNDFEFVQKELTNFIGPKYTSKEYPSKIKPPVANVFYDSQVAEKFEPVSKVAIPQVSLSVDEQKETEIILTDLLTYVTEMEARFIFGEESLDKWDDYIATMKQMRVDELVSIQQAAYDRYMQAVQ
jgi:putative aldouronate transport system substrate-binding protein